MSKTAPSVEGGEAAAWRCKDYLPWLEGKFAWRLTSLKPDDGVECEPLYAHPPTAKGDTGAAGDFEFPTYVSDALRHLARLIEHMDSSVSLTYTPAALREWADEIDANASHAVTRQAAPLPQAGWLDIASAPRDHQPVLLLFKQDCPYDGMAGVRFVGRYYDKHSGWGFAAPVGYGGIAEHWLEGWQPLPAPPTQAETSGPQAQGTGPAQAGEGG